MTSDDAAAPSLSTLPHELVAQILAKLPLSSLYTLSLASKHLYSVVSAHGVPLHVRRRWLGAGLGVYVPFVLPKDAGGGFWWSLARRCDSLERAEGKPRVIHGGAKRQGRGGSGFLPVVNLDPSGILLLGLGDAVEVCRLSADGYGFQTRTIVARPHGRVAPEGDVTAIAVERTGDDLVFWTSCFDGTMRRHALKSPKEKALLKPSEAEQLLKRTRKDAQLALTPATAAETACDLYLDGHAGRMVSSIDVRTADSSALLLSAGFDGTVRLWSAPAWRADESESPIDLLDTYRLPSTGRSSRPWAVRFLSRKATVAAVGHRALGPHKTAADSLTLLNALPCGTLSARRLSAHRGATYGLASASLPHAFASAGYDGTAALWDLRLADPLALTWDDLDDYPLYSISWDGGHRVRVGTGRHGVCREWDARMLREPRRSVFAFGKDTPVYGLGCDLARWFVGGEGSIAVVEF
ncbi:hypothetical protein DFJ74DRAFT_687767 [Hyaloraphidium curvatum]|nr:hypothetical protein DFJ74DRAFT_687767 [Hyaloraphidium curvatum]